MTRIIIPHKQKNHNPRVTLTISLPLDAHREIVAAAARLDVSLSSYVGQAAYKDAARANANANADQSRSAK